jgi:hypothetical protein
MSDAAGEATRHRSGRAGGLGHRALPELDGAWSGASPRERLLRVVEEGRRLRRHLLDGPRVRMLKSFELARFPYPARYGLRDALSLPWPYLCLANRVFIVRYAGFDGVTRTLLVSPSDVERNAETPYFKGLAEALGPARRWVEPRIARRGTTVLAALASVGLTPEDVDFITYDHLHTQDLRGWLGTGGQPGLLPNARLLVMGAEWRAVTGLVAPQRPWYCPDGAAGVDPARVVVLEGSVELGAGVALVATPGHTEGNHSIVLRWGEGVTVTSENGICPDAYEPSRSAIPGLAACARRGMDVVLNGNTLERGLDQYVSMVLEKTIAGPSARDPRFPAFLASSELTPAWYAPGLVPTLAYGDVAYGEP